MSKPFVAEDIDAVNCTSTWQSKRSYQDGSAQTAGLSFIDSGDQSKNFSSSEVQTDAPDEHEPVHVDMTKLAAWLTNITPRVLEELDKNHKSRVFDEYKLLGTEDGAIEHLFTLLVPENHNQSNLISSAIDWSSTGGTIAVARRVKDHPSWCEHAGNIALHHMRRKEMKPNTPYRSLTVNSCVTVISAHPNDPFILACGTYSGEVTVWNLQKDEAIVIGSLTLHSEAVVHLEWVLNYDASVARPVLASASRDGSVIIWTVKSISGSLRASQCLLLQAERENTDLGIVCAKFNSQNPHKFLAGIEGGSIVICTPDSKRPCLRKRANLSSETVWHDPVENILDGHKGSITGLEWVPGNADLFLSCGSDSELHVYSSFEEHLIRIIHLPEPSSGLEICWGYPNVVVTWGSSGAVYLHDIHTTKKFPPLNLAETNECRPLCTVRVLTASSPLFALGDIDGNVSVWQIPHNKFSNPLNF